MKTIEVYTDGACSGNPGPMGIGVILVKEDNTILYEVFDSIGDGTNNIAEAWALRRGVWIVWRLEHPEFHYLFKTDSQLLTKFLSGEWKCKSENLRHLICDIEVYLEQIPNHEIQWIPRDENLADKLAKKALK